MTRFFSLAIFLLFLSNSTFAQQVLVRMGYAPKHSYALNLTETVQMQLKYSTDKKAQGSTNTTETKQPSTAELVQQTQMLISTGNMRTDSLFTFKLQLIKSESANGNKGKTDTSTVYGHARPYKLPAIDSTSAQLVGDKAYDPQFLMSMQAVLQKLSVHQHLFKIGEKFTEDLPFIIPVGGRKMEMAVTTTYKLTRIANGMAYFNISAYYTVPGHLVAILKGSGNAKGKAVYDIDNNYYLKMNETGKIKMNVKLNNRSIKARILQKIVQNNSVAAE